MCSSRLSIQATNNFSQQTFDIVSQLFERQSWTFYADKNSVGSKFLPVYIAIIFLAITKTESWEWEIKGRQQISHTCHQQTNEFCKEIGKEQKHVLPKLFESVSFYFYVISLLCFFHLTASPLAPNISLLYVRTVSINIVLNSLNLLTNPDNLYCRFAFCHFDHFFC